MNENLFNTFDSYFNAEQSPLRLSAESAVVLPKGVGIQKAKQQIKHLMIPLRSKTAKMSSEP